MPAFASLKTNPGKTAGCSSKATTQALIAMNLKEKLQQDVKDALKSGDSKKRMVLGMVMSAIKNKEIEKRGELSEEDIVAVVSSEIKKRRDSVEQYEKGGRPELAEGERKEAEMLMAYMPEQMSEEDVRDEVKKAITETGLGVGSRRGKGPNEVGTPQKAGNSVAKDMKEMGKVIGAVMAKIKGKVDGQTVSRLVKEELSK